jgi:hypothetical protein
MLTANSWWGPAFTPHTLLTTFNILYTQHTTHQLIFMEGGKPENPEKNPRSKGENKLNSYMTPSTESVVRGEHPDRYATHDGYFCFQQIY